MCKQNDVEEYILCESNEVYERSVLIKTFDEIELSNHPRNRFQPISTIRSSFLNKLITEISNYFDLKQLKEFDTFLPANLPNDELGVPTHSSISAAMNLASIFGLSVQETADQWKDTLIDIVSSSAFERHRNDQRGSIFTH